MARLTAQQLAELTTWVETYSARTQQLSIETAAAVMALYSGADFYSRRAAAEVAEQAADLSNTADLVAAGLATEYLAMWLAQVAGEVVPVPSLALPPIRNGVPLEKVFERPMKRFRRAVADGVDPNKAFQQAMNLAEVLVDGNIRLAQRDQSANTLARLPESSGVTGYRRVVHPELSETGTCGLCIVASDMVYKKAELMPLHDRCKCTVAPIYGELDPGSSLNNLDLGDLYQDASDVPGSRRTSGTHSWDLKKIRYEVNEHGEWGPVLTVAGQHFTGPDDLAPAA